MTETTVLQLGIRRSAEMAALFMIGDGLLGLLQPERHVDLWRSDISAVDVLVRPFAGHPTRRRAYGLLQIGAGILLASALTRRGSDADG
ncbi:hypothetical protein [Sphingomonas sp. BAUL-RG-20F-R05-02]|uniref:hypothetical protein n=1 Tax=Sphingomonas sp. BAUL-RG-20F-R05-02 TaxID=2914830 RepID=UPI001F581DE4|nr:hypothetical protein [Sphingomonas sp. BAUL-RG-20F-R05-02]